MQGGIARDQSRTTQRSRQGSQTAAGRKRTMCAQTLTARTPCNDAGNSKPPPPRLALWQAKRAGRERSEGRRRQGWKPEGARRHRRLDAQHDSPARHRRETHECLRHRSVSTPTRKTCDASLHKATSPQNRQRTSTAARASVEPQSRDDADPQMTESEKTRIGAIPYLRNSVRTCSSETARDKRGPLLESRGEAPRPSAGRRATISRPCCATRSGCARRHRPRPDGHRWSPGTTGRPGSPTGRAGLPC